MSKVNDGGTAFPIIDENAGLSIRDYMAAVALQGIFTSTASERTYPNKHDVAAAAYAYADAMLEERKK
jgi:hypothetical protein